MWATAKAAWIENVLQDPNFPRAALARETGIHGAFAFPTSLTDGAAYAVTVGTQPAGAVCTVTNGSGTVTGGNVTTVAVTCSDRIFANGFDGS